MKKLLAALLLIACPAWGQGIGPMGPGPGLVHSVGGGGGGITRVDTAIYTGSAAGGTSTAANAAGANLGVLVVAWYGADDADHVTDSNGNTWTRRINHIGSGVNLAIWDCQPCTFTNGMTVHVDNSIAHAIYTSFGISYYSGVATSAYGAAAASGGPSTAPIQPGSLTAPGNGYLYLSGVSISAADTASINSSFTIRKQTPGVSGTAIGFALADNIQATAAALNPTWSGLTASDTLADMGYWSP